MPFLLNLRSRQISECTNTQEHLNWLSVRIDAKRLVNCHHDIEWEYFPAYGLLNTIEDLLIVQSRDDAFDIEYYTREGTLMWDYGPPCPIIF